MRLWRTALTATLLAGCGGAVAAAHHHGAPGLDHYVGGDGTGTLVAKASGHEVTWERCPPDAGCVPHGDGEPVLRVADEAPGTTFVATQADVSIRSNPWQGRLRAVAPPRVEGELRSGAAVRPVAATWEGGWGRERDWLQLQACKTAEGSGCVVIVDEVKFGRCRPEGGRVLGAEHEGRWLQVVDARLDRDQPMSAEGYGQPEGIAPLLPSPGRAAAVVGRVARGSGGPSVCGRSHTLARLARVIGPGRLRVATVRCVRPCEVTVTIRQGRRAIRMRRSVNGSAPFLLTRSQLRRLRGGRLRASVWVDGRMIATARPRLVRRTARASAATGLDDPARKEIAMKLVSSAENSSLDWRAQYRYIEDIKDGRGYTAGIIGFCSGTGDMLEVVRAYTRARPRNGLRRFLPALRRVNGSDSHRGLGRPFVAAWRRAAADPRFRRAQDRERDGTYFDPSVKLAKGDGLRSLGQFAYYDAAVVHGFSGMRAVRERALARAAAPAAGGDETAFLEAFLDERVVEMRKEAAHEDVSRIESAQRRFLREGNLDLLPPLRWSVYGDEYSIAR